MGTFRYPLEVGNSDQSRFVRLEAWVDSGSSYTWIPQPILAELDFTPAYRRPFKLANGQIIERDLCQVPLRIGQETILCLVVFGDEGSDPLLGATALEDFALGVDAVHHTLVPIVSNALSFKLEAP